MVLEYSSNKIKYLNARKNYWKRKRAWEKGNVKTTELEDKKTGNMEEKW